jgi:hypothetical protein
MPLVNHRWLLVGSGAKAHLFLGDQIFFAICSLGPASQRPVPAGTSECRVCAAYWARELAAKATVKLAR